MSLFGSRFRKWLVLACLFGLVSVFGVFWCLFETTACVDLLLRQAGIILERQTGISLKLGRLEGSLWDGLAIEDSRGMLPGSRLSFSTGRIAVQVGLLSSLQHGLIVDRLETDWVRVVGPPCFPWLERVPDVPSFACFAGFPGHLEIRFAKVNRMEWAPAASSPLVISFQNALLESSSNVVSQPLKLEISGKFRDRAFLAGSFSGQWAGKDQSLTGVLSSSIVGQSLATELTCSFRKSGVAVNGQLGPVDLDVSSFSRWLCPIWQASFPVTLEGHITGGGSWAYEPKVGFLANLKGEIRGLRLIPMGMFFSLAEFNSDWSVFDGRLELDDKGSSFLGAQSALSGKVSFPKGGRPLWDLALAVPSAHIEEIIAVLPWPLKFGLGLPEASGVASLAIRLDGTSPSVSGKLFVDALHFVLEEGPVDFHGHAEVCSDFGVFGASNEHGGLDEWKVDFGWSTSEPFACIFNRLKLGVTPLRSLLAGPVSLSVSFSGPSTKELNMRGTVESGVGSFSLGGIWRGDGWAGLKLASGDALLLSGQGSAVGSPMTADGLSLWGLTLLQGR